MEGWWILVGAERHCRRNLQFGFILAIGVELGHLAWSPALTLSCGVVMVNRYKRG